MTRKRPKADRINDCYIAYKAMRAGDEVKRHGAKDGSIPTHPVVDVPDVLEKEVVKACGKWLTRHNIFWSRHETGAGNIAGVGYATYGIKNAGDIIGLLRPSGRHFEIECKRGRGGRLSKGQQKRRLDIKKNNGIYLVVHGVGELEYLIKDYHIWEH